MATSDRPGAGGRFARYLGSAKNLTGGGLAVAAVAAELTVGLGDLWPLVVGGAYGVGALLAPPEPADLVAPGSGVDIAALRLDLGRLGQRVATIHDRLDGDLAGALDEILDLLRQILDRAEKLALAPDDLFVVAQTIRDYLPTSLEAYLNLPRTYALPSRMEGRRTARDELAAQLGLLRDRLTEVLASVLAGDVQALVAQGRFLQEKFGRGPLDL